jgi:hypothetical protein
MTSASVSDLLFDDARAALVRQLNAAVGQSPSDDAFAAWLLPDCPPVQRLASLASSAASNPQAETNYRYVATLGFAAHDAVAGPSELETLARGLLRLAGRQPFVDGSPMSFCTDAVALLGIALGAKALAEPAALSAVTAWMTQFLSHCYHMAGMHDWQRCLFALAQSEVGAQPELALPRAASTADVRVALRAKGCVATPEICVAERDEMDALLLLKTEEAQALNLPRLALRLAAFDWIRRSAPVIVPHRATVQDVSTLLHGVSAGLRRWTWEDRPRTPRRPDAHARKWDIDNEYHVQNLLYVLLAPMFPDLRDEENFPSVGQKKPRTDLFIPSLKLIIEVKFMYPKTSFQGIIGEIAEDASLYLAQGSAYAGIIAFVWDDAHRTEEYSVLVRGLRDINGVIDAVVVPRPGFMDGNPDTVVHQAAGFIPASGSSVSQPFPGDP